MRVHAASVFVDGRFIEATVELEGARIVSVVQGRAGSVDLEFTGGHLVPGFIDAHCHGGGGAAFTEAERASRVLEAHRRHGVTSMIASLVTDDEITLAAQLDGLAPLVRSGELLGVHLEGPWLAHTHRGAHPADLLRNPEPAPVQRLIARHPGIVRMVTIAPELPHAFEVIPQLRAAGVVVAVGHTAADYDETLQAIGLGATGATHLFNAMPTLHHREPGPVLALLDHADVVVELIADGVHVHPALVAHVMRIAGDRACLVTDAMAAADCGDGEYLLGRLTVQVRDGVARVATGGDGAGSIAGSTLTLDRALRNAVAYGVPLVLAVAAVTSTPARYLGFSDIGRIAAGAYADLVHLDDDLEVRSVMRRGSLLHA